MTRSGRGEGAAEATRSTVVENREVRSERARRPVYLFSGLLRCGACGGGYVLVGARHYGCANSRNGGTCMNRMTLAGILALGKDDRPVPGHEGDR